MDRHVSPQLDVRRYAEEVQRVGSFVHR
jgi:hypothetical protein